MAIHDWISTTTPRPSPPRLRDLDGETVVIATIVPDGKRWIVLLDGGTVRYQLPTALARKCLAVQTSLTANGETAQLRALVVANGKRGCQLAAPPLDTKGGAK